MKYLAVFFLMSQFAFADQVDVIYGDDNRKDVYDSTDSLMVEASKSTAAMIRPENLKAINSKTFEIQGQTLESRGICKAERFSQQISAANCSGFLVKPNLLVTAGHCVKDLTDCSDYKWVFDYKLANATAKKITVPKTSVYSCKGIIARALNPINQDDYAVIQLDRNVTGRKPLSIRKTGKITKGTDIVVIGHPTGLPTKIADGAQVRSLASKFFVANLDTYGGNSGSAVLNAKTGAVEGILVRGENDYVMSEEGDQCQVSNVCPATGCRGEDVTFITGVPKIK